MSDNQLKYGATNVLRCEFPSSWPAESITAVTVVGRNTAGTATLASGSATLYTATTINGGLTAGTRTIVLANTAGTVYPGDRFRIAASAAGGAEDFEVESYVSGTKTITTKRDLYRSHTTGAAVYPLFATKSADLSSATLFPVGSQLIVGWTPNTGGAEITDVYTISKDEARPQEFAKRFRLRYPDYFTAIEDTIDDFEVEATRQLRFDMAARGRTLDRIVDQELYMPPLLVLTAYLVALGRGDQWSGERDYLAGEYQRQLEAFSALPVWTDDDQSQSMDEEEEVLYTSQVIYTRGI